MLSIIILFDNHNCYTFRFRFNSHQGLLCRVFLRLNHHKFNELFSCLNKKYSKSSLTLNLSR